MMDWEKAEAKKQEKKRQRNAQEYGTEEGPEYIREELGMLTVNRCSVKHKNIVVSTYV